MPQMPPWPKERVVQSIPFEYTGLDYFGPLYIKNYLNVASGGEVPATKKVWVCLFTCFAVRAVYIELVEDMSAEEFCCASTDLLLDEVFQSKSYQTMLNNLRQQGQFSTRFGVMLLEVMR